MAWWLIYTNRGAAGIQVAVCVCVTSPWWQCGGHEVTGWQQFRGDFTQKCEAHLQLMGWALHIQGTLWSGSDATPCQQQALLLSQFRIRFHPSKASIFYSPLDSTCQHHPFTTPPGVPSIELAAGPYRHHNHQWLRRTVYAVKKLT